MSYKVYICNTSYKGCELHDSFEAQVRELIKDMEAQPTGYHGKAEIEVEYVDAETTITENVSGLTPAQLGMVNNLKGLAASIVTTGGNGSKIKNETEVEKE